MCPCFLKKLIESVVSFDSDLIIYVAKIRWIFIAKNISDLYAHFRKKRIPLKMLNDKLFRSFRSDISINTIFLRLIINM